MLSQQGGRVPQLAVFRCSAFHLFRALLRERETDGALRSYHTNSRSITGGSRSILPTCELLRQRSVLLNASASGISCTPAVGSALLAHAGSGLADTVDHYPARPTAHTGLHDHVVRLMNRRERYCMSRCRDRKCKASNGNQPDHSSSPSFSTVKT